MVPLYFFQILYKALTLKQDINPLNKGAKKELTGKKKVASSQDLLFTDIKRASRYNNMTINNMVTSVLSTSMGQYFKDKGENIDNMNIAIPANIRFKPYSTQETVKCENKFAALGVNIPL
jgi:hypothetical protein